MKIFTRSVTGGEKPTSVETGVDITQLTEEKVNELWEGLHQPNTGVRIRFDDADLEEGKARRIFDRTLINFCHKYDNAYVCVESPTDAEARTNILTGKPEVGRYPVTTVNSPNIGRMVLSWAQVGDTDLLAWLKEKTPQEA